MLFSITIITGCSQENEREQKLTSEEINNPASTNDSKLAAAAEPIDRASLLAAARTTLERLYNDNGRGVGGDEYDVCVCIDTYSYAFKDSGELCLFFLIKSVQPHDTFIYVDPTCAFLTQTGEKWNVDCFGYELIENPEMEAYYDSLFVSDESGMPQKVYSMPQNVYQDYGDTGRISIGQLPY